MRPIMGAVGLIGAIVIGLLAVTQVESLVSDMNANASGGLNTLIGSLNFLLVILIVAAVVALVGVVVKAINRSGGRR